MSESKPRPFAEKLLFLGGLWLAIATALLCAIVPSGLPGSESRGSAFNPSNSVVALRAKSTEAVAEIDKIADKDKQKPATHVDGRNNPYLISLPLSAVHAAVALLPLPATGVLPPIPSPVRLLSAIFPRGPPAKG